MKVYLINPSDSSFGISVITPRWLYVLAAATPSCFGDPVIVDETLEQLDGRGIAEVLQLGILLELGFTRAMHCVAMKSAGWHANKEHV